MLSEYEQIYANLSKTVMVCHLLFDNLVERVLSCEVILVVTTGFFRQRAGLMSLTSQSTPINPQKRSHL